MGSGGMGSQYCVGFAKIRNPVSRRNRVSGTSTIVNRQVFNGEWGDRG
ncbi:MAG: hypothetical protein DSM106950_29445 [Stigonema ocellatum SAG 48.90 = DSM 106950]|nr:hypothetical protein [Stigonema ocellatum SAG 48.90 = DSM 106950]